MKENVMAMLQRINFIETDMEMQKQILFSIPSDQKEEMEKTVQKITELKEQINDIRQQIKAADPEEYDRIIAIERATEKFRELAGQKKFVTVNTLNETGECFVTLNDGTRVDCLVAAKDDQGDWTLLSLEGDALEYPGGLIQE